MPRPSVVTGVRFLFGRSADIAFVTVGPFAPWTATGTWAKRSSSMRSALLRGGRQRCASLTVSSFVPVTFMQDVASRMGWAS
jgi:hypothetical protein